jgi:hypothetical protein
MALLNIHAHLNHIQLAAVFMASDLEYDAFLPEYTAIVELAEQVYPYLSPSSSSNQSSNVDANPSQGLFRFDLGVVYPLSSVGFRCRDSNVRGRAISLLGRSSYREGIWDAVTVACLTDWIRKVEEEGMDENAFIAEDKRAVLTLCDVDLKSRSVTLRCMSKEPDGKRRFRTETMGWRFGIGN